MNSNKLDPIFARFHQLQLFTWISILLGVIIFMIARTIMLVAYAPPALITAAFPDITHAYQLGLLFDLQIMAYCLLAFFIFGSVCLASNALFAWYLRFYQGIMLIIFDLCIFFACVNFYFYQYFNTQISSLIFYANDGRTAATLITIWQYYPVLKVGLLILICSFLFYFLLRYLRCKINNVIWKPHPAVQVLIVILGIFLFVLSMRGSIDKSFPLREKEAIFSNNHLINQLAINGLAAFVRAYENKSDFEKPVRMSKQQGLDAYNIYLHKKTKLQDFSYASLFTHTKTNSFLKHKPPNVIFVQMESMGRHFLLFNHPTNNLLGELAPHIKHDILFTHFLSSGDGTSVSMGYLLLNSPTPSFFRSVVCSKPLPSSVAKPFKEAGYETIFLTSDSLGYENLGEFLRSQDFDYRYGMYDIKKKIPQAQTETWGVYDQYTFQFAYQLLHAAQRAHKPIFLYINTVTNHPPYSIPSDYHLYPIKMPENIVQRMLISRQEAQRIFESYQYAADALGHFMNEIKHSSFANNTIIAASGDHNQHELMFHYPDYREYALQFSVPFLLHIPKDYQPGIFVDKNRIGSHKDIFPTLYNLALSHARYLNLGNNLLSAKPPTFEFAYNRAATLIPSGILHLQQPSLFYPWQDQPHIYVKSGQELNPQQQMIAQRIAAYTQLLLWQVNWEMQRWC